ncbi:UDP-glucose 4-epimerase GalE [compost metagenome]
MFTLGRDASNQLHCDLALEVPQFTRACQLVIHNAGKAHSIPHTQAEKDEFFRVNVQGTANLLQALENTGHFPEAFVFVSSVAVYGREEGQYIAEQDALTASDAYGLSKIRAEQMVTDWCAVHGVRCTILRLPLLVGRQAPGNLGSMIKGIKKGFYVNVGGGKAKRSMVLPENVAAIIPAAAAHGGVFHLTDGYHPSFAELSTAIAQYYEVAKPVHLPFALVKPLAVIGDLFSGKFPVNSSRLVKLTSQLTFDDSKARELLGWQPDPVLNLFRRS